MSISFRSLRSAVLVLLFPIAIYAQVVGGSIGGIVSDSSGAAIRGAGSPQERENTTPHAGASNRRRQRARP